MVLTIKNFGNPVGPGVVETAPTNLVGVAGTLKATLTWTSATGESGVVWTEEKLVRKEGSAPQGSLDGTTVTTITTKDTYASTGYEDTGLDHTKTYYYKAFAIYDNGTERGSTDITVTPLAPIEAGIYHSATLGLITIADGNGNEITIADKNLGATQVYNDGDTLSEANCGKYYQWGNNYGFPRTGSVTTSSTKVDASTYGPGNYYSSSTFITTNAEPMDWSSVQNDNLRGGVTGTNIAMQGPCATGFHVPTKDENVALVNIMTALGINTSNGIKTYLKMPFAGVRKSLSADVENQGTTGGYGSSTGSHRYSAYFLYFDSSQIYPQSNVYRAVGFSIRPFKNEVVAPDNTWTKLYEKTTPLCFTANTAGSTVGLGKSGNPTAVTLEISTDGITWTTYTQGSNITLSNIGDKVYFRNTSESNTSFSLGNGNRYQFQIIGGVDASGDVTTLVNKNGLLTMSDYCLEGLFANCTYLISAPKLPSTTLGNYCYKEMFYGCANLITIPKLEATTLANYCYQGMFQGCSKIKLSTTQTGEYQTPYRIPTTGTGTSGTNSLSRMFSGTGGTFTSDPTINTTYYTSNQVI